MIEIYTDGACSGNPGPGGWAAVILEDGSKRTIHGREPDTTNNRMELLAVIKGLEATDVSSEVKVFLRQSIHHKHDDPQLETPRQPRPVGDARQ